MHAGSQSRFVRRSGSASRSSDVPDVAKRRTDESICTTRSCAGDEWKMCGFHRYAEVSPREEMSESNRFIDSQCNSELDAAVAVEYRDAAAAAGRPFVPVYLRLSREENARRIASSSRVASGTGKLVDADLLLSIRDSCDLFEFGDVEGLHLDATGIDADEAARKIYRHVHRFV
jgi:hypothetical protein